MILGNVESFGYFFVERFIPRLFDCIFCRKLGVGLLAEEAKDKDKDEEELK